MRGVNPWSGCASCWSGAARVPPLFAALAGTLTAWRDAIVVRKYDAVRARRGSGLSAAADGRCSTCNISLPPMLYQRIMQAGELFQCPSCQRILYFTPPSPSAEGAEADGAAEAPAGATS